MGWLALIDESELPQGIRQWKEVIPESQQFSKCRTRSIDFRSLPDDEFLPCAA
jgi:hypothetical protein